MGYFIFLKLRLKELTISKPFQAEYPAISIIVQFLRRSQPAQHGETFDGPPTLERSGSEHRVGRFPPSLLRREGRGERWSLP